MPSAPDSEAMRVAMIELYAQFEPMVRLAHLLTGSMFIAEDVVHDAMLRVAPRYQELDNPKAYFRTAVVNGCRSHQRSSARRVAIVEQDVESLAYEQTSLIDFFETLTSLRYRERCAVVLRYYSDLPDEEIAEILGCAPATVRVLVKRGLGRLRKVVGREGR
jgi:RNA polymerase sigma factor (sigma-70 family)